MIGIHLEAWPKPQSKGQIKIFSGKDGLLNFFKAVKSFKNM